MAARRPARSHAVFVFCVLVLIVLFLFGITYRVERSFLIEARTTGTSIVFAGIGNAWNFPAATLCAPRAVPDLRRAEAGEGPCGADLYVITALSDETLDWPDGASVDVHLDSDGAFVIELLHPIGERPAGTLIVVAPEAWAIQGALTFRGTLSVGEVMASGARHFLLDGRWEARESGWAISLFRGVTEVVKQGALSLGAEASIIAGDGPAIMYGHLTPSGAGAAMTVTAISQPGDTALRLVHFGFEKPSVIRPDWIDTALASPFLLALVALLGLLTSVTQVLRDLVFARREDAPAAGGGDKAD